MARRMPEGGGLGERRVNILRAQQPTHLAAHRAAHDMPPDPGAVIDVRELISRALNCPAARTARPAHVSMRTGLGQHRTTLPANIALRTKLGKPA